MPEVVALLGCELCLDAVQLQSVISVHSILVPINSAAELVGSMPWRRFRGQRQIDRSAGIFSFYPSLKTNVLNSRAVRKILMKH